MGEVWLTEQQHALRRQVASKLIKPGMDSRQQFRNEIDSPETRDPLKRPGEPPNRPQESGAAIASDVPQTAVS